MVYTQQLPYFSDLCTLHVQPYRCACRWWEGRFSPHCRFQFLEFTVFQMNCVNCHSYTLRQKKLTKKKDLYSIWSVFWKISNHRLKYAKLVFQNIRSLGNGWWWWLITFELFTLNALNFHTWSFDRKGGEQESFVCDIFPDLWHTKYGFLECGFVHGSTFGSL